ncbi:hypothetical protein RB195_000074 [Necator americanus]|uniref:B box-type domain-containing protein n=1 Tax=Necator americanus TaxID=51031 RepID=A0ABR1D8N6_NECAM
MCEEGDYMVCSHCVRTHRMNSSKSGRLSRVVGGGGIDHCTPHRPLLLRTTPSSLLAFRFFFRPSLTAQHFVVDHILIDPQFP